jgi:hypothetical protein
MQAKDNFKESHIICGEKKLYPMSIEDCDASSKKSISNSLTYKVAKFIIFSLKIRFRCNSLLQSYFPKIKNKKILLLSEGRTGSTLLLEMLSKFPKSKMHLEPLAHASVLSRISWHDPSPNKALNYLKTILTNPLFNIVGSKIHIGNLKHHYIGYRRLQNTFPDAYWIILYRKSLLDQYISSIKGLASNQWHRTNTQAASTGYAKVYIKPDELASFCDLIKSYYRELLDSPIKSSNTIIIDYESLTNNVNGVRSKLKNFLSVSTLMPYSTQYKKMSVLPANKIITNYNEIKPLIDSGITSLSLE